MIDDEIEYDVPFPRMPKKITTFSGTLKLINRRNPSFIEMVNEEEILKMKNNEISCPNCNKPIRIRLIPDYASSGIWCDLCSIEFSDPKYLLLDLPKY